jgi:uncharacterized alkaline shock family protein YloU
VTEPFVVAGPEGSITVGPAVLTRLVVSAAEAVDGARVRRPRRSVEIDHSGDSASVSLELSVRHGAIVPEVARAVQERVAEAVSATSGLEVRSVDVSVEEVA